MSAEPLPPCQSQNLRLSSTHSYYTETFYSVTLLNLLYFVYLFSNDILIKLIGLTRKGSPLRCEWYKLSGNFLLKICSFVLGLTSRWVTAIKKVKFNNCSPTYDEVHKSQVCSPAVIFQLYREMI